MGNKFLTNILSIVFCLLTLASVTLAQRAEDVVRPFIGFGGVGARSSGLAEAFSGVADDFSAMYYNPAGLANITWAEVTAGGSYYSVNNTTTTQGVGEGKSKINRNYIHTNSLAYVWPAYGMKFTLGIGYHNVAMMNRAFNIKAQTSMVGISEQTNEESHLGAYTIAAGYQLQKEISVGLSFHLYSGGDTYSTDQLFSFTQSDSSDQYIIDDSYSGIGATMGVLFAPKPYLRTGISLTIPKFLDVNESLDIISTGGHYTYDYQFQSPPEINLGQSVNIGNLMLVGNVTWKDWSLTRFRYRNNESVEFDVNNTLRNDYASVLEYAGGAELLLPVINLKLRGGVHYIPNYLKSSSTSGRTVYALGASLVLAQQFKIDLAYNLINWKEHYNNMYGIMHLNGTSDITTGISTVNFSYRF